MEVDTDEDITQRKSQPAGWNTSLTEMAEALEKPTRIHWLAR